MRFPTGRSGWKCSATQAYWRMESRARLREEEGMLDRRRIAVRLSIASALRERASDRNCAIALCCEGYR